jgi:hypothetical protein
VDETSPISVIPIMIVVICRIIYPFLQDNLVMCEKSQNTNQNNTTL